MIQAVGEWLFVLYVVFILWCLGAVEMIWHIVVKIWHFIKDLSKRSNRR